MRLVVADTGPLNYLVLIGASDLPPRLFETVLVPQAVCDELRHPAAPAAVRAWAAEPPAYIRATNFRYRPEILDALLAQHSTKDQQG